MNRQFCRIFLILLLGILLVCLPAQAAHAGQSGPSSLMNDHGSQVNVSSELSASTSAGSVGKGYGSDIGSSGSSPVPVQPDLAVKTSSGAQDRSGITDKSTQSKPVNANAGSSPLSGSSGDFSGRSYIGNTGRADAGLVMGSSQGTGAENYGASPDNPGQFKGSGGLASMLVSPGGVALARSASGNENG